MLFIKLEQLFLQFHNHNLIYWLMRSVPFAKKFMDLFVSVFMWKRRILSSIKIAICNSWLFILSGLATKIFLNFYFMHWLSSRCLVRFHSKTCILVLISLSTDSFLLMRRQQTLLLNYLIYRNIFLLYLFLFWILFWLVFARLGT